MTELIDSDDLEENDEATGHGKVYFVLAIVVGVIATLLVIANLFDLFFSPAEAIETDQAGRTTGRMIATLIIAAAGYAIAQSIYNYGMAAECPETHSDEGKLKQLLDATKHVEVSDYSSEGFYANASENELVKFHSILSIKTDSPRFAALVLEIRRRTAELEDER